MPRGWRGHFEPGVRGARRSDDHQPPALARPRAVLYVQRPFYPEADGTCHLYLLHPPGGVVGGDELEIELDVGPDARVLATTPAATKLYRSPRLGSVVSNRLQVKRGGVLEWLPGETLAFGGTKARLSTTVELEPGARFLGWEITCLGRPAAGDDFTSGRLDQRFELSVAGRPVVLDRTLTDASGSLRSGAWGWAGRSVHGLFLATFASKELTAALRDQVRTERPGDLFGVTTLGEVTVCRYLGTQAADARECLSRAWELTRRHLLDKPASAPRILDPP